MLYSIGAGTNSSIVDEWHGRDQLRSRAGGAFNRPLHRTSPPSIPGRGFG